MGRSITSLLESQGYTLAVLDTAANIDGADASPDQQPLAARRASYRGERHERGVVGQAGRQSRSRRYDGDRAERFRGHAERAQGQRRDLSTTTIAGLPALGVSGIVSTNGSVTISVAQALALEGADLAIAVPSGDAVTLSDLASNIAALTPSQIDGLPATGVSGIAVSNSANLALSAAQAQALEAEEPRSFGRVRRFRHGGERRGELRRAERGRKCDLDPPDRLRTPALSLDVAQALDDTTALGEIVSPYTIAIADTAANVSANHAALVTLIDEGRVSSLTRTNVTGQAYSSYEQLFDDGVFSGTDYFFTNVTGEPYSAYEYDYSAGNTLIGSKFDYTGITGQPYTGEVVDYNGAGLLTSAAFTGVTGAAYSAYQYGYVGGVFAGSQFTFTTVPTGATYSSYETDYDQAAISPATSFFFTNIQGQSYTAEEESFDAGGALSSVLLTGIIDQAYSSLQLDYSAGTYEGYQAYYRHHGPVLYPRGGRRLRRQSDRRSRLLRYDVDPLFVGRGGLFRRGARRRHLQFHQRHGRELQFLSGRGEPQRRRASGDARPQ